MQNLSIRSYKKAFIVMKKQGGFVVWQCFYLQAWRCNVLAYPLPGDCSIAQATFREINQKWL